MNKNDHEDNFQLKKKVKLSESWLIMPVYGGNFLLIKVDQAKACSIKHPT